MRTYKIIVGSKLFFESQLSSLEIQSVKYFLELVKLSDDLRILGQKIKDPDKGSVLIVKNDNYHGIVESAHDRLGNLIEDLTKDDAIIFVHNPPSNLFEYVKRMKNAGKIILEITQEEYSINGDKKEFKSNIFKIQESIIGQEYAINEVSKSLWYLSNVKRTKPYVIMLYGNSSLGKTELVKEIAKYFFNNKLLEKHLSMFKNQTYSEYFFGEAPNRKSLGYDLLERDSNLIFLDEIDKCPDYFYSAFYTLFDNEIFKDKVYDVNISGSVIILTSNYLTEKEIMEKLGLPIYYRIDKFIHFKDFEAQTIYDITMKEINSKKSEFENFFTAEEVYNVVSKLILGSNENARTIKNKVQAVIEELLFRIE